jgi:hypothetical protein
VSVGECVSSPKAVKRSQTKLASVSAPNFVTRSEVSDEVLSWLMTAKSLSQFYMKLGSWLIYFIILFYFFLIPIVGTVISRYLRNVKWFCS